MSGNYKDLRVWKQAMDVVFVIYEMTKTFPQHELYGLTSQMRRAAVSIACNIAEGKGRTGDKELAHFLSTARGSLRELETQVLIAAHLGYLSRQNEDDVMRRIDDVGRMLSGLLGFAKAEKQAAYS